MCLLCFFVAQNVLAADTYTNPIIDADYSDPDVIRVGDDFYLTASSFNSVPGLPILHSRDLVNWKIIGHALQRLTPEDVFSRPQHGNGVWAPPKGTAEKEVFEELKNQLVYLRVSCGLAQSWDCLH